MTRFHKSFVWNIRYTEKKMTTAVCTFHKKKEEKSARFMESKPDVLCGSIQF